MEDQKATKWDCFYSQKATLIACECFQIYCENFLEKKIENGAKQMDHFPFVSDRVDIETINIFFLHQNPFIYCFFNFIQHLMKRCEQKTCKKESLVTAPLTVYIHFMYLCTYLTMILDKSYRRIKHTHTHTQNSH